MKKQKMVTSSISHLSVQGKTKTEAEKKLFEELKKSILCDKSPTVIGLLGHMIIIWPDYPFWYGKTINLSVPLEGSVDMISGSCSGKTCEEIKDCLIMGIFQNCWDYADPNGLLETEQKYLTLSQQAEFHSWKQFQYRYYLLRRDWPELTNSDRHRIAFWTFISQEEKVMYQHVYDVTEAILKKVEEIVTVPVYRKN